MKRRDEYVPWPPPRPDYPEESWELEAMRGIARLYGAVGLLVFVAGVVWALWFS